MKLPSMENDDQQPKMWYKATNPRIMSGEEVKLDMNNNLTLSRILINTHHTLIFHNITYNDSGLYYCRGLEEQEAEFKYNFLLDSM